MKGKTFESEVSASLRRIKEAEPFFFYRRLLDSHCPGMRVPADFLAIHAGKARLFECKSTKNKVSFPFRNVAEHQISDLVEAEEAGAESWILIKHSCRHPALYAICIKTWVCLMDEYNNLNLKSVKWTRLQELSLYTDYKNQSWDLWPLFKQD